MKIIEKLESILEFGGIKKEITLLIISGLALLLSLTNTTVLPFHPAWIAVILCGIPIILEAVIGLVTEFDIEADVLVSLALIASICIGEYFAAGEIAFIMQIGALLEDLTVARARAGIEKLVHLTPQTARVIRNGEETVIPAEEVQVGDCLRVLPGETIPVDGVIISGETSINQAVMTGESLPVDKTVGDDVASGTVNQFGAFEMKAAKVGKDSSIQRMIQLVQSADAGKAKIVGLADRWATWIVVIALTAAALTWLISGEIIRAVTILVVFCPCALVLATPTAIMAAIGNAAKHGFLVKEGDALERLAGVKWIAFDKTGTLTHGTPRVVKIVSVSDTAEEEIFRLAAAAEQMSEHPLGKAVLKGYRETHKERLPLSESFQMLPGKGVVVLIDGQKIAAGNAALLGIQGAAVPEDKNGSRELEQGSTVVYIARNEDYLGYIVLADTLREESAGMIKALSSLQVKSVLLTGDNAFAAEHIAKQLGISEVHSSCLPEDKLRYIDGYQQAEEPVCMVGDGINDAPALKKAMVGIAMGGTGSDIAVDAADIALVDDEVKELPHLIGLSKRMMTTIRLNLTFSMALNFAAIVLAITGILNPVVGALVHNAGSVLVIINSAFLLRWKSKAAD